MELETLLERCREGDELAWEALVRQYQGRLLAVAYHYLRDREEARDAAQEIFVRVYRNLDSFEGAGRFRAWLMQIARNCCLDRLRRARVRPVMGADELDETRTTPSPRPDPESSTLTIQRRDLLERALQLMTPINREIIVLKDIQGLKQREIAHMLEIPLGTVKARSYRARLELADRVLELDPSFGA